MVRKASIDNLNDAINEELELYSQDVTDAIKNEAQKSVKDLVTITKQTAPTGKRKRHYKNQITSTKVNEDARSATYAWYVKAPDYRLTHLLNNGHQLKNGGRYAGTQFLTKAVNKVVPEFEKRVEEVVKGDK